MILKRFFFKKLTFLIQIIKILDFFYSIKNNLNLSKFIDNKFILIMLVDTKWITCN